MEPKDNQDLIYKEECYQVVGILIEVFKELGSGYQEKYYQRAVAQELINKKINFQEQVFIPLFYKGQRIGNYKADFIVELNGVKIAIELKRDKFFSQARINQLYDYLKAFNLKLGILANFTKDGLKFKRIVNLK